MTFALEPGRDPQAAMRHPRWSVSFRGQPLLKDCRLSLSVAGEGDLLEDARLRKQFQRSHDAQVRLLWGKSATARDRYREYRLQFDSAKGRRFDIVFRCFDDAVAFRYEIPRRPGQDRIAISDESSSFGLAGNPTVYAQYPKDFRTSHEHQVSPAAAADLKPGVLIDTPLHLKWPTGEQAAITEASLRRYGGIYLARLPSSAEGLVDLTSRIAPRPDGSVAVRSLPMETPWRVVLVGNRAGALIESNTIYCLNDPPLVQDISWIKPGKMTWPWWNGNLLWPDKPGPILSLPTVKAYVDWCAKNGIPYHSVIADEDDTPWYVQSRKGVVPGPDTDPTKTRPGFDMTGIREYAASKGVRLWTWVHQAALKGRVEESFAAFARMGWHGMMVDFFDHDDQETVEHAEAILRAAARHRIMVHFHGIWKPGGWQRTFPHLMNHEGALNLEYLKWSDLCTPRHNLMMPFTRMLSGPMDYHLGGFRAVPKEKFKPQHVAPLVMGTRGHHLAMYVCYDNPMPMVADYPGAYENQPGFDFLREVPTWWDETHVLAGEVGRSLVIARRRGSTWWLGGMAAGEPLELSLPLGFLGNGTYSARIWKDSANAAEDPNSLDSVTQVAAREETLTVRLATDGGFVARLTPPSDQRQRDVAVTETVRKLMHQIYAGKVDTSLIMPSLRPEFTPGKVAVLRKSLKDYGPLKRVTLVSRKSGVGKDVGTFRILLGQTVYIGTMTVTTDNRIETFLLLEE